MARFQGADGIIVETFDDVDVVFPGLGPLRAQRRGGADTGLWEASAILDAAAAGATVTPIEIMPSAGPVPPNRRSGRGGGAARPVTLDVPVGDGQNAALLTESEGVYQWQFPEAPRRAPSAPSVRRGGPAGRRTLRFRIGDAAAADAATRRGRLADLVGGTIFDRVRVYVLRFVARAAVANLRDYLERNVVEGLVAMKSDDPESWTPVAAPPVTPWPTARPARALLMVHGTFSSTLGSFGALGTTDWGRSFLTNARTRYDAIVGYDHSTLVSAPEQNAEAVARALDALQTPAGTTVDIVAYSRGGLVARVLAEGLLALRLPHLAIGRVVYVGSTNAGTALADPENWRSLLDLTTNLAAAAGRILTYAGHGLAGTILRESVKTIGGLVQAIVDDGVNPEDVSGLAAMRPGSPLIAKLDAPVPEQANPPGYFALGSHFQPRLFSSDGGVEPPRGMSAKLALALANFASDAVMGQSNDLVVDNAAMKSFGARSGRLKGTELWGDNIVVYHTNYFQQSEIVAALNGWLLTDPPAASPTVNANLPAFNADDPVAAVLSRRAEVAACPAIVIRRTLGAETLYYVRAAAAFQEQVAKAAAPMPLLEALQLHESDRTPSGETLPAEISADGYVLTSRGVLVGAVPPLGSISPRMSAGFGVDESTSRARLPGAGIRRGGHGAGGRLRGGEIDDELVGDLRPLADDGTPVPPPASAPVDCHFMAAMAPTAPFGRSAPLSVTVSREIVAPAPGATSAQALARVRPDARLTVEVTAVSNCEVDSQSTISIEVPEEGQQAIYDFAIRGLAAGPGEIWVDARDGLRRLARLVLQPTFLATEKLQASASLASTMADPPFVRLRIFDIAPGRDAFSLQFELESRDLGLLLQRRTETFNFGRESYISNIYRQLELAWGGTAMDEQRFMLALRPYVAQLYTTIVPQEIRRALWQNRTNIGSIEVMSQEPFIPWEILQLVEPDKDPEIDAPFLAELGLVRWIANSGWAPASLRLRKDAIYHVIPEYVDPTVTLASAQEERRMLEEVLSSRSAPIETIELVEFLREGDFDLLHFACHGNVEATKVYDANLELKDHYDPIAKAYFPDLLTVGQVQSYANLRTHLPDRPIVFINACQTGRGGRALVGTGGMAEAFVGKGAGALVAALWSVNDSTAFTFARTFYQALLKGETLTKATLAARRDARTAREPTWLAYTVYGHPYARVQLEVTNPGGA